MSKFRLSPRDVLTPDALAMLQRIAEAGSFAAAARTAGMVPSALTYRVRQIEDALDVLLFDRSSRHARLTPAGAELLREGTRLLCELDAVANRVKRVATGWEAEFTLAVDGVINRTTVFELCEAFLALEPPTRLRLRDGILSGTLEALTSGQADLALGVVTETAMPENVEFLPLGNQRFIFTVAPHHPLASAAAPLDDATIGRYRAVAVADSATRGGGLTIGLLGGQDVFTVPGLAEKLEAQLRGIGVGFLPECLARPYIDTGRLVAPPVARQERIAHIRYAWRKSPTPPGKALAWWQARLADPVTRVALLERRSAPGAPKEPIHEAG
ncbi:LysR family transcriptional regulator [Zoogloea sp.]|jgi:DNA-binding transcriptional LysR family regulator|uniref:LysR family transcriptional regulator n=1 Tax=Zoogloea sp. TaxID=49181 RepID=UPI0037DA2BFB